MALVKKKKNILNFEIRIDCITTSVTILINETRPENLSKLNPSHKKKARKGSWSTIGILGLLKCVRQWLWKQRKRVGKKQS